MLLNPEKASYEVAVRDFHHARKAATMQQLIARLKGEPNELLDFEQVSQQLRADEDTIKLGLQEIPLDKIVGSVGRYKDFTREFLPKLKSDEQRWANVRAAIQDMSGMPPIEVYQVGDAYFVLDGNHRVSVARSLGVDTISAYVTQVKTRVALSANDDPDQVICKARYANFLAETNFDELRPNADLTMTFTGHYKTLLKQIGCQRKVLAENAGIPPEQISYETAVTSWYDTVYIPMINLIREMGVMRRFSNRTETDIYVLLFNKKEELEGALGWHIELEEIVPAIVEEDDSAPILSKVAKIILPDLGERAQTGTFRKQQLALGRQNHLFSDILVLFEGIDEDWALLQAAIKVATSDKDRLLGLRVSQNAKKLKPKKVGKIKKRFLAECKKAGLVGEFAVEHGDPLTTILKRAAWSDLLMINLTNPPGSSILSRLRSGFWGPLIERSPRPILILPHAKFNGLSPILLAYDGSSKSDEALFLATYFAVRWEIKLTVLTVETEHTPTTTLSKARNYLNEYGVTDVEYLLRAGKPGVAIIETAKEVGANSIIMGGFGAKPVLRMAIGSSVEYVLQNATQAIWICR